MGIVNFPATGGLTPEQESKLANVPADTNTELAGKETDRTIIDVVSGTDFTISSIVDNAIYKFDTLGNSITVTIPDTTDSAKHCKFILASTTGDITVVTSSGEQIGSDTSQLLSTYQKGFEVTENATGYIITQDARPSSSNVSVNFYPTITPSVYEVTYNQLVTDLPTESEITAPAVTSVDDTAPTSLGFFINDNAALDGIIPETNIIAVGNVSKETEPTADLKFRFKYYEYDIATTTLNPTSLATSEYSATVDSTTTEQKTISAVLPSNDWTGKVLVIELQAYKLSGATNPVMQFISGGTATSKTYLNVPVASINLDSLGGTLSDTKVNLSASYSGNLSGKTSQKDANDVLDALSAGGGGGTVQNANLSIQPTDEGTVTGNARGDNAVDFQTLRQTAAQVASARESVIVGGRWNENSGFYANIVGGYQNLISAGHFSFIGGGNNNQVYNEYSVVCGGNVNRNYSSRGFIGGGENNRIESTAFYASLSGGRYMEAYLRGQSVSGGYNATSGKARQDSKLTMQAQTTDTTPTEIFLDGSSARAVLKTNSAWSFEVTVLGYDSTNKADETFTKKVVGVIYNDNGTVAISTQANVYLQDNFTGGGDMTVSADDTNNSLKVTVTGKASATVIWQAKIQLVEIEI